MTDKKMAKERKKAKRLRKQLRKLKRGDTVIMVRGSFSFSHPVKSKVLKVGKKYITVDEGCFIVHVSAETGKNNDGAQLFTLETFNEEDRRTDLLSGINSATDVFMWQNTCTSSIEDIEAAAKLLGCKESLRESRKSAKRAAKRAK